MKHRLSAFHCLVFCWVFRISSICHGRDTLEAGQVLRDGEFLESSSKLFQLKFFKLEFSENRYLGIQMKDDDEQTSFVWVANRDKPLMARSGVLNLTRDGILIIDGGDSIILNVEHRAESGLGNINLTILDTGNLVLRVGEEVTWQSFDYPTDTLLLGMKLGLFDLKSGGAPRRQFITSWFSPFLPASGPITLGVDPDRPTELTIWRRGAIYWQSSNWIEIRKIYGDMYNDMNDYRFDYFSNENESYFALSMAKQSGPSFGITMNSSGAIDRFTYFTSQGLKNIRYRYSLGIDLCGSRETAEYSGLGCASIFYESLCLKPSDVFYLTDVYYVEGKWTSIDNSNLSITDCEVICRRNCSCTAYSPFRLDGSGCNFSTSQKLRDRASGPSIYISKKVQFDPRNNPLFVRIFFPIISVVFVALVISCGYLFVGGKDANRRRTQQWATGQLIYELRNNVNATIDEIPTTSRSKPNSSTKKDQQELPLFSFSTLKHATDGFSIENKIGQGGFGPVYKGKLGDGREIAVKRLSRSSGQGTEEFKNEVILISKLQHRSLVRLLGCCIQAEEKLLVYEYMPNKSLYSFLFDEKKRLLLDWRKRFSIIEGIAQGLLYLHKYSRLRIIHRDLKTSNILLDSDLNPKIADFGLARSIGDDETQANTMNIAGTRGYMSPEYAMGGLFSEKSDVFSFGVMVLEIISGKKNASFYHSNIFLNLLGYAWDLWREERFLELLDPGLEEAPSPNEVTRCVQIGLLCVQENAVDRPNMADIVSMLINESNTLPTPKKPAFLTIAGKSPEVPTEETRPCSINVVTISSFGPR